jgi:integrase
LSGKTGTGKTFTSFVIIEGIVSYGSVAVIILEPSQWIGLSRLRVTNRLIRTFNNTEIERLVLFAPDMLWRARILVAAYSGLRIGEILNLNWNDIHLDGAVVIVQPKEETAQTWEWHPKDYEIRELPLSDQALECLKRIHMECPANQPYPLLDAQAYMKMLQRQCDRNLTYDERRLPDRTYYKEFVGIVTKAKIGHGTMHDLRRSAITAWAENKNLQPHEVMKLAGHSSLDTTLKYYVQTKRSMIERARVSTDSSKSKTVANLLQMPILRVVPEWLLQ